MDPFRAVVSAASVENSETKETATTESVELEAVNLSPLRDDGLTLIEIAKTPNCSADDFLARARARPDEIGLTDERFEEIYGHIPESPVERSAALVMEDLDVIHSFRYYAPQEGGHRRLQVHNRDALLHQKLPECARQSHYRTFSARQGVP